MALPVYLAMTAAEFTENLPMKATPAWMACHFSSAGIGLSNFPSSLPEGAMLIVNDEIPPVNHSPDYIAKQLQDFINTHKVGSILLDFQRSGCERFAEAIGNALSCPVAVTARYANCFPGAVFLPPPPVSKPLEVAFSAYNGREIWLELLPDAETLTVTKDGCASRKADSFPETQNIFESTSLSCRYCIEKADNAAIFTLQRQARHLIPLLEKAAAFGVSRGIGLLQDFM